MRRSREISVFNLSMLDMFACALGAFVILTVISLAKQQEAERAKADCEKQPCGERCPCEIYCEVMCDRDCPCREHCPVDCERDCKCEPPPPFVVIILRWEKEKVGVDIDLHVTDSNGRKCSFESRTGCAGELVYDHTRHGTTEAFVAPKVRVSSTRWKVHFDYYGDNGGRGRRAAVSGFVYYPGGKHMIPARRMGPRDRRVEVLQFWLDEDGNFVFENR